MSNVPLADLLDQRIDGHSLPQAFYTSQAVLDAELDAIFARQWVFAANEAEIKRPGQWMTVDIGPHAIILARGKDGEVRAFHNSCRHRGARVCLAAAGSAAKLVCPYHQWTYNLDGSLFSAREMPRGFAKGDHGLRPVRIENICGLLYVCLAEDAPSLDAFRRAVTPYLAPHQPARTKVAYVSEIVDHANWKLVIENNRECYHCRAGHPELMASMVEFALPDAPGANGTLMTAAAARWDAMRLPHAPVPGGDEFRCIRLPFKPGYLSFTLDGALGCTKLLGDLTEPDLGSVRMFHVPNNWNHFVSDHVMHARVTPLAPDRTLLRTVWLVHEDAVEGIDYDPQRLAEVWLATNEQDGALAEINQRGVQSSGYRPGPYAPAEFMVEDFIHWYVACMAGHARGETLHALAAE